MKMFHLLVLFGVALAAPAGAAYAMGDDDPSELYGQAHPDYAKAKQAIEAKDWDKAVEWLERAAAADPKSADVYNYLGYAERHRGNLRLAFQHYQRALTLDPKHRGAHEYIGAAYLMVNDVAKAEEHLAALDKLCFFPCREHRELREKIAQYKRNAK